MQIDSHEMTKSLFPTVYKKSPITMNEALIFDAWQCPTLAWGDPKLPSAIRRFTSEFEMGSGGTNALWSPGKLVEFTEINFQ